MTGAATARGPDLVGGGAGQAKGSGAVRDGRRGYRDLERAGGRLALIDRLAALLARTPAAAHGLLLVPAPGRLPPACGRPATSPRPPRWRSATCCAWSPEGCGWAWAHLS